MAERPYVAPKVGSRKLWELDVDAKGHTRATRDPERDEICKALSREDQIALMDRYGLSWGAR